MDKEKKNFLRRMLIPNMELFFLLAVLFSSGVILMVVSFFTGVNRDKETLVLICVFSILVLGLWSVLGILLKKNLQIIFTLKKGVECKAVVTKVSEPIHTYNGIIRYAVDYEWMDENCVKHKWFSRPVYTQEEAYVMEKNKVIDIKVYKGCSIIINIPKGIEDVDKKLSEKLKYHVKHSKEVVCDYCGKPISKTDEVCPNCKCRILK